MHPDEGINNDACIITNNDRKQFLLWGENLSIGWINFTVYVLLDNFWKFSAKILSLSNKESAFNEHFIDYEKTISK